MTTPPTHPVLTSERTLRVDGLPEDRRLLEHLVVRGALIVTPELPLRALEELDVTIALDELANPLRVHCTVVILQPSRAVLKLDDASVIRADAAQRGKAKIGPPTLEGDVVRFAQEADLSRAEVALCQHGFVMALPKSPTMEASHVRLALAEDESDATLGARILPHPSGSIAIQIADAAACAPLIEDLRKKHIARRLARRADDDAKVVTSASVTSPVADPERNTAPEPPAVVEESAPQPALELEPPPFVEIAPPPVVDIAEPQPVLELEPPPFVDLAPSPVVADVAPVPYIADVAPVPFISDVAPAPSSPAPPSLPAFDAVMPEQMSTFPDVDDDFMPPPSAAPAPVAPPHADEAFAFHLDDDEPSASVPPAVPSGAPSSTETDPAPSTEPNATVPPSPSTESAAPLNEAQLDGHTLRYPLDLTIDAGLAALTQLGALFVLGEHPKKSPDARIRVAFGDHVDDAEHDVLVMAGGPGHVVVQPQNADALAAALQRLKERAVATAPVPADDALSTTDNAPVVDPEPAAPDEPPPSVHRTSAPPRLVDGTLFFDILDDVAGHVREARAHGAILAIGRLRPGAEARTVDIIVSGKKEGSTPAQLAAMSEDTVVVMWGDREAVCALLEAGLARAQSPVDDATSSDGESAAPDDAAPAGLASSGHFKNPTTPDDILAIPMVSAPTTAALAEPSLPLLLRVLFSSGRSSHVLVEADNAIHRFAIINGTAVRAMTPLSTLGRALSAPSGTYLVEALPERMTYKVKGTSKELLTESLRGLIGRLSYDDLPKGFANHEREIPSVPKEQLRTVDAISFTGTQTRLLKSFIDARHTISEIVASPAGARAAWEALYLLEIFRALHWELAGRDTDPKKPAGPSAARAFLDEIAKKNHFEVLGVHWSGSPKLIEPAYRTLHDRWSLAGPLGKADPASARQILTRVDEAYTAIKKPSDRQNYRRDVIKVKWSQQIEVMIEHAKLAIYRKSFSEAQETLDGLLDFHTSPEVDALVRQLAKVRNGGKADDS